ncbi:2-amino-4-hydroxy-6-hydroxymethyldihydropteridine diphosphokinase [Chitinophaga caeni]|uniref:2-amino-4-hydroxy-6-hydroxymethyldihydropteridine pyrophosphokinase n=1 Tax=Chitinophaga caeni TaxID=2029983 RepID=A0A291QVY3_9BACT|nr:2-amino-4-hydroxy-6-hydroxymethyldihydropteridine diphosphokinase [Chitinophaga caeni]ATL48126.1 2-amino-4-hydroxy-6-hydroxymethyldihydropteridine diphosphokinase [Chitinophaga caeni]
MNRTILLLGGNLGDRIANLQKAVELIQEKVGQVLSCSKFYETAPWGNPDQPDFINQALVVDTPLRPVQLMLALLEIEKSIGRIRHEKWGSRLIDIDIIFYNDAIIEVHSLQIPHPRMQKRRFVLVPIAEIAPSWVHPELKQDIGNLLASCEDSLEVRPMSSTAQS